MEHILKGIAISSGIAISKAKIIKERVCKIDIQSLHSPDFELKRFEKALEESSDQVSRLIDECMEKMDEKTLQILKTHLAMINDYNLKKMINSKIKEGFTAEYSSRVSIDELKAIFALSASDYKKERAADFEDIGRRIINALSGYSGDEVSNIKSECIIVAKDLIPSQAAQIDSCYIKGIITEKVGETSHSAIIARILGIPAVIEIADMTSQIKVDDTLIIDGDTGEVIVNPDEETLGRYKTKLEKYTVEKEQLRAFIGTQAKTLDGKKIQIECNIGTLKDLDAATQVGADGIGLFRTEFLFMDKKIPPAEEEQYAVYRKAAEVMNQKPVVIRTLDIGGDKEISCLQIEKEANPFLGNRAIRFCFERKDIFKTQLKAILRAAVWGNIKIMFPMISGIKDLTRAKKVLEEAKRELKKDNIVYKDDIEVGVMIEIPSAAITSDILAKEADFFSIGTNDLVQYTMAADRTNEKTAQYYDPLDLGVIRLISLVCKNAENNNINTSMCGEMAGNLKLIPLILGLGVKKLSVNPSAVLEVKSYISKFSYQDAVSIAERVLLADTDNIMQLLDTF